MFQKNKLGQIGIFVVISVIIVTLIIFLSTSSFEAKTQIIEGDVQDVKTSSGEDFPLKDAVDLCLSQELKKATILAGLRGGLIYDYGENSAPSNAAFEYGNDFLSNIGININYVKSTLIHSQYLVFMPRFNSTLEIDIKDDDGNLIETQVIYNHTIEDDFEKYILKGLGDCLDYEKLVGDDYVLNADRFGGKISNFDLVKNKLTIERMDGDIGDTINFDISGKTFFGKITSVDEENDLIYGSVTSDMSGFSPETFLESINVINLNSTLNLSIDFDDETINLRFEYPMNIERGGNKIYFEETDVFIEVRFKKLLQMAETLLRRKGVQRNFNLNDFDEVNDVLLEDKYYQGTQKSDLNYYVTIVENREEYKLLTYSFIDGHSKIFGSPFIFNFGYENSAPEMDTSLGTTASFGGVEKDTASQTNDTLEFINFELGKWWVVDLKPYVYDRQKIDNYITYFNTVDYNGADINYKVSREGVLEFKGFIDKKVKFDVTVTDGETTRTYPVLLVMGVPGEAQVFEDLSYLSKTTIPITGSNPYRVIIPGSYSEITLGSSMGIVGEFYSPYPFDYTMTGSPNNLTIGPNNIMTPSVWESLMFAPKKLLTEKLDRPSFRLNHAGTVKQFLGGELPDISYTYTPSINTPEEIKADITIRKDNLWSPSNEDYEVKFKYENKAPEYVGYAGGTYEGGYSKFDNNLDASIIDPLHRDYEKNLKFKDIVATTSNSFSTISLTEGGRFRFTSIYNKTSDAEVEFYVTDGELSSGPHYIRIHTTLVS